MWQNRQNRFFAAAFIAFFVIAAALSVWKKSSTWDEPMHLTAGVAQLQTGDPRLHTDHPPLARLLAAVPALFMNLPDAVAQDSAAWKTSNVVSAPVGFFGTIEDRLLWPARLMMLSLAVLLGWMMYAWGNRLFGPNRAWFPLALLAFCPLFLANAPLVANDMAITTFIFASFYTWWRYLQAPSLRSLAWTCLAVAAAFSSKYTAFLLIPSFSFLGTVALVTPAVLGGGFKHRLRVVGGAALAVVLATWLGINAAYFFDGTFLTPAEFLARSEQHVGWVHERVAATAAGWPAWLPVPLPFSYVVGLILLSGRGGEGHWTYFMGQTSYGGWAGYFLMLLLVKLPIPTLMLVGLGAARAISRLPREWWNVLCLALPPLLLIWIASSQKYQVGIRHIMPSLPFLFLLAAYVFPERLRRWHSLAIGALLAWSGLTTLAAHPHYLMYFNFLAGGPEQGWRISINGDDWGQGDADLARWLQARGITEISYVPFGWGQSVLHRSGIRTKPAACEDNGEVVAAHAGKLLTPISPDEQRCFQWMRGRQPDEKIGYNIFIYNSKNLAPGTDLQSAQRHQQEGSSLYNAGKYAESIAASLKSLQFRPDNAVVLNNICAAYNELGNWDDAIKACSKAIELRPDYELARNNLAWAEKMSAAESGQ